ncbi:MAG TPA: PVC-type heme-binding CxxCH protein [Verrucomicrobiae bacterium]|nr:PVC-type heme-binding CxxCH protein [Verrucomicrobiae bacterium]
MRRFICLCGVLALGLSRLMAAEPDVDASQLPRVPPTPPEQSLSTFRVKAGFRLELVAAEPLVVDPIAMSFDEDGRLYVVEMRDYSERRPERLGRIRRLEDLDGDGRFEKSTVFADGLPWPTAVTCWAGGVFVGATPDILWMKDTNGDGVADEREVIFTGFAADYAPFETNKLNVQALMNSFQWSLDNRIHGATSFSGGKVKLVDTPFAREWLQRASASTQHATRNKPPLDLRGRDFSFDPRTLEMRAESGGGQHGMTFDNQGRKFVCSNSDHIQQIVYEDRYVARNPYYTMPSPRVSIAADGPAAEVFRISPDEPWRVLRTQWRVAGLVSGPVEGGGRASGYFTGATGLTIYRGDAYGEDFVGDAFIGDAGGNLVHRKKLRPDGILLRAERPPDEQKVEFLASTDNWFRPVQFANAPDGCLYIADMYREVIEHPWSLPPNLKKHLDLNSGNDRGRIYRIVPDNFKQPPPPRFGRLSAKALAPKLAHANGWHRDTVARLLYERQDKWVVHTLTNLVFALARPSSNSRELDVDTLHYFYALNPRVRDLTVLHALYALNGLGLLEEQHVLVGLEFIDSSSAREGALKLAEQFLAKPSATLLAELQSRSVARKMASGDVPDDLQLAFTFGRLRPPLKHDLLIEFLRSRYEILRRAKPQTASQSRDRALLASAVISSLGDDAVQFLTRLREENQVRRFVLTHEEESKVNAAVASVIGARNRSNEVQVVTSLLPKITPAAGGEILAGLASGLQRSGLSLDGLRAMPQFQQAVAADTWILTNRTGVIDAHSQLGLIRILGFASYRDGKGPLLMVLSSEAYVPEVRSAALAALAGSAHRDVAADLIAVWPKLEGSLRTEAINALLKRPDRTVALLDALETKTVPTTDLTLDQSASLRTHRDTAIRERAFKLLGKLDVAARASVVESFEPALQLKGEAANGKKVFLARCATCHKLGSEGHTLGPDLATVKSGGKEKLLVAILDPNREVAPNFLSYAVETKDGESLSGVLASENANSVTLRMAGGAESVIARANIASLQSQGRSLMPEGLEEGLKPQDMADLLEFIVTGP